MPEGESTPIIEARGRSVQQRWVLRLSLGRHFVSRVLETMEWASVCRGDRHQVYRHMSPTEPRVRQKTNPVRFRASERTRVP